MQGAVGCKAGSRGAERGGQVVATAGGQECDAISAQQNVRGRRESAQTATAGWRGWARAEGWQRFGCSTPARARGRGHSPGAAAQKGTAGWAGRGARGDCEPVARPAARTRRTAGGRETGWRQLRRLFWGGEDRGEQWCSRICARRRQERRRGGCAAGMRARTERQGCCDDVVGVCTRRSGRALFFERAMEVGMLIALFFFASGPLHRASGRGQGLRGWLESVALCAAAANSSRTTPRGRDSRASTPIFFHLRPPAHQQTNKFFSPSYSDPRLFPPVFPTHSYVLFIIMSAARHDALHERPQRCGQAPTLSRQRMQMARARDWEQRPSAAQRRGCGTTAPVAVAAGPGCS